MLIIFVFTIIGLFFVYQRSKVTLKIRKAMNEAVQKNPKTMVIKETAVTLISFVCLTFCGFLICFNGIESPQTVSFGILVILLSIAEAIATPTVKNFYYDEKGFYAYTRYIHFNEVDKCEIKKVLFNVYAITLKTGEIINVSKKAFEIIETNK